MRRVASLDANHRRLKVGEQPQHLGPAQFAPECRLASLVDAVDLEHVLGDVEPNYLDHLVRPPG